MITPEKVTKIEEHEYAEAVEAYTGWCTACKKFTRDSTEPDAQGYDCPECEQNTVIGAEDALMLGHIDFTETA